jgi:aldehyde:ferredoxin oxidoreductase
VALSREEMEKALDRYYEMAGWTREGIPTPEKLRALGLGWLLEA